MKLSEVIGVLTSPDGLEDDTVEVLLGREVVFATKSSGKEELYLLSTYKLGDRVCVDIGSKGE